MKYKKVDPIRIEVAENGFLVKGEKGNRNKFWIFVTKNQLVRFIKSYYEEDC
jgi:hypothetical protein